jgi:predicted enzyme related to lactoylglutathione lyase
MKGNAVGWFEIYVQDIDRAKRFYEAVFEVTLNKLATPAPGLDMWAFPSDMNTYGTAGAIVKMQGVPSGGNSVMVYFMCEDCAVEEGRVKASGGRVHRPKMAVGEYGWVSLVTDTEGNMIGLHSMK